MNLETILYEVDGGVATITLNRPDRYNAFTQTMAGELKQVWAEIKRDPEVVCVILTAAGEKAFCTGMDIADVATGEARGTGEMDRDTAPWFQLTAIQNQCWKPVITAVNGMVNGGGLHFIADSDLIVCAENATFFDTHVKVGFISGIEPVGLARRIPLEQVLRLALLGGSERMDAQTAKQLGLVGEVVPLAELMPRARQLAEMISQHSPTALALSKKAIWESLDRGLDDGIDNAWELIQKHTQHPDLMEGAKAFVEKRKPNWAGFSE